MCLNVNPSQFDSLCILWRKVEIPETAFSNKFCYHEQTKCLILI